MVSRRSKAKRSTAEAGLADMAGFTLSTLDAQPAHSVPMPPLMSGLAEVGLFIGDVVEDQSILARLIALVAPRHPDAGTLAASLLRRFGSLAALLSASEQEMQEVLGKAPALHVALRLVQEAGLRLHRVRLKRTGVLADRAQLKAYLSAMLAHEVVEQVRVLFLDARHHLLADEMLGRGTVDHTPVYPREVVRRALELQAEVLVLVHNHPSGDPSPSQDDILMTQRIAQAATLMGITIWDHVIVGGGQLLSLKEEGLF
ncbi:DNA repair protein RadC [Acetobacter farinalis]|uniref:DNA repair protein RadC n=1 Tax=Acetobacter farinalis TaxID=1260984 RepID=A0ABT3Q4L1_9PROT|nr:DNA repair protein RadC [Acetobacter farinalis]MCX2560231.1 DNA repair protein RadC [Acetobacter farinalis]